MNKKQTGGFTRRRMLSGAAAGALAIGFPHIVRAQGKPPIKIGMPTTLSGPYTYIGESSRAAAMYAFEAFNAAGGLEGRMIELIARDDKIKPDEGARITREMINNDGCDIILAAATTTSAFAIQEVIRETGHLCIHSVAETTSLSADPKLRTPNSFRCARQGLHDVITMGKYGADLAHSKKVKRWMTASPDFAYGRSITEQFVEFLRKFAPDIEIVSQVWPKYGTSDYTDTVAQIVNAKPDMLFSSIGGGDIVALLEQARLYGAFDNLVHLSASIADIAVLKQIKKLPPNTYSVNRYVPTYPADPRNLAWFDAVMAKYKVTESCQGGHTAIACDMLIAAMRKTNSADGKVIAEALRGLTINTPFGADGKVTMRAEDQTLIGYALGCGKTDLVAPYFSDVKNADWGVIIESERDWKKAQGFG